MTTVLPRGEALLGRYVQLDLLVEADLDEMYPLLADPEIYANGYVMHRRPFSGQDSRNLVRDRFLAQQGPTGGADGGRTTYAVRLASDSHLGAAGTLVGTSSLSEADLQNERIHLGSTLYGRRWWGTQVNAETKLLLLGHCFENCGFGKVKFQTDVLNTRSQEAISRLGVVREGVTRRDIKREDGTFRDSVVFSILKEEWPQVKSQLQERLG